MSKINILDPSIYNLIAAGEVVERPVSVVKELVENSIDAGATDITVEIKDGGTTFIQISDNGSGIDESDFKAVFLPHATSKIKIASDLETIGTLGFRGEALASIASVAKVTLTSRTSESELASCLSVEGGVYGEITKIGANVGTTITVKDLFFCVPARAKFLKKNKTEEQEITSIMTRIILAHPEIYFTYIVDGKKNLSSLGSTAKEALFSVYGKSAVAETIEVKASRDGVSVYGFVGKPTFSKSNRTYQTLIVNGRYVVNLTVQTAVTNAYGDFLMKRQYPFFVLYLTVPSDEIDVNVHPNKLDVRFLKTPLIYSVVFEAVSRGLHEMDYVKEISMEKEEKLLQFNDMYQKYTKVDKAGVNLNPFSSNFDKMDSKEKESISGVVLDSIVSNNQDGIVRDNFGLGSKLLERISAKMKAGEEDALDSPNYSLNGKTEKIANFDNYETKLNSSNILNNNANNFLDKDVQKLQNNTQNQDFSDNFAGILDKNAKNSDNFASDNSINT
ncbi:MAG: DNA mismatch repair endonuclease MutL, partial [Treponema sp.]|nr:DNA mismatch repair endonuclease MutL [Treponema sp.]